ncbi:MAG: energy-coupling factor transporter ATPase [Armatimonadota bacterium]|nr:energy-coupling factor transporter ATPase [Armatimonadota bacterium]MDR7454000.1 energy-coupling factor transporter ATPase [Armatimonadota bacterium]MDR7456873.1 energy-coupling factor transporter ATPase [Armatimonadota bacterium]MDR7511875.1 energy-coupling factor transporter ATPase [Armatimonadota bacterium]
MGDALIEVRDLTYVYHPDTPQAVRALDGLSCSIRAGEFVGVVGGNGSGKSTFARHLNALLLPTAGEVRVGGLDTRDRAVTWEVRRRVGMVFQNPDNQLVAAVVEEDVAFGPENLGLPPAEIRRRVDEALEAVGLAELRRRAPHQLSGGQKQRVAIAGVLAMRPACIVLDEATTMLDPQGRAEVLATVEALNRRDGITVVLISHAMDDLVAADRVLALDAGRLVADGPPAEVFERVDATPGGRLDAPPVVRLARELRQAGLRLPPGLLTVEALADAIADALGGGAAHA